MLECVPNVSEGRDLTALATLAGACGDALLDVHHDPDHHRAVFTLAGPDAGGAERAVRALAEQVAASIDVRRHAGVHPRLGALDVVPFVALAGTDPAAAVRAAHSFGAWAAVELGASVFFYDEADERARTLPATRRQAFRTRAPDVTPTAPRAGMGAIAVGARPPLVAVNCELATDDLALAQAVARAVRERDGGLPGVRALGLRLRSRRCTQVSMNLVALGRTGVEAACIAVRDAVRARGGDVARVELVGLLPAAELARCSPTFVAWSGLTDEMTVEHRLRHPRAHPADDRLERSRAHPAEHPSLPPPPRGSD